MRWIETTSSTVYNDTVYCTWCWLLWFRKTKKRTGGAGAPKM